MDTGSALKALQRLCTIRHQAHHTELLTLLSVLGRAATLLDQLPWSRLVKPVSEFDVIVGGLPDDEYEDQRGDGDVSELLLFG